MILTVYRRTIDYRTVEFTLHVGPDKQHLTATGAPQRMSATEFDWFVRALQLGGGGNNVTVSVDSAPPSRWLPLGSDGQAVPRAVPTDPGYEPDSQDGPDLDALAGGEATP